MKVSAFLAVTGAILASANTLEERHMKLEVVTNYVTVTVTAGAAPTTTRVYMQGGSRKSRTRKTSSTKSTTTTCTSTTLAQVYTTTTPAAVVAVPTTTQVYVAQSSTPAQTHAATGPNDMATASLQAHNEHRSNHSAPAMSWLDEIAGYAANTAASCKFAHDMDQGSGNYGQNIAMWATSNGAAALGAAGAMKMATHNFWYNAEVTKYPSSFYGQSTPDMSSFHDWGHFSQLVWKSSTSLGCHAQLCPKGTMYADMDAWYMVCNYRPVGNVGGAYGANVLPPLGKSSISA